MPGDGDPLAGPAVTPAQARAAVRAAAASFEIVTPSLPGQPSDAAKAAVRMNQWGIVAGPEAPLPSDITTAGVELRHDGAVLGSASMTQDIIDDPFVSLTRLCAALAPFGLGLEPGDRIITGSLLAAIPAEPGRWEADFGPSAPPPSPSPDRPARTGPLIPRGAGLRTPGPAPHPPPPRGSHHPPGAATTSRVDVP